MQVSKSYAAKKFTRGALFCPACRVRLEAPVAACPACGFSGNDTVNIFGLQAPPMDEILDITEFWSLGDRKEIQRLIALSRKKFPQISVRFLHAEVPAENDMRLFAFWFFNVSPLTANEDAHSRQWTILLAHDTRNARLAITLGYAIEPFVSDDEWERLLVSVKPVWRKSPIAGVRMFFLTLHEILAAASKRAEEILRHAEGHTE